MKKVLVLILLLTMAIISSFAQEKDVTKFLGIPVDGTKAEMIAKLKEKGFTSTAYDKEVLEGEFNGRNVTILLVTNGNKVYRVGVCDKIGMTETNIKDHFNILFKQFSNNGKYMCIEGAAISEDEDISYEMIVKNKQYSASFIQCNKAEIKNDLYSKYSEEEIKNFSKEKISELATAFFDANIHKTVCLTIHKWGGEYFIMMLYDNELNKANGDDL